VTAGRDSLPWLRRVLDEAPTWSGQGPRTSTPLAPIAETGGVLEVRGTAGASWRDAGPALPALGDDRRPTLLVASSGRGRVAMLAESAPLSNRLLAELDNARLGLALAGPAGQPVVFAEGVHGYGTATGLAAVPDGWRVALAGLAAGGLLLVAGSWRRLGPPERAGRELPPPRRAYAEALGALLARTDRPVEALAPVRAAARGRLETLAGVGAGDDRLRAAGRAAGLADAELDAVLGPDGDALAAGRALARLQPGREG
jgi:hypothetical protein